LLQRRGKLPEKEASFFMKQLLLALSYLHNLGITHRDIKLENILLLMDKVKLCDFGCARRKKQFDSTELLGTIDYLSPEVAASKPYNHKTDVWAAGVVLHEMVFGRPLMGNMK
jgi:serine/threonine protein kinase